MRIESKLCHISDNKAVVQVNGWLNDINVGSALAEASTVELAEDKAISRLHKRLDIINNNEIDIKLNNQNKLKHQVKVELPKSEKKQTINIIKDPTDWSEELSAIDAEIERLKWSRNDEIEFIERNLGYNNRNKITKYNELVNYLNLLKKVNNLDSSKLNKINRNTLIENSDIILRELSWDHKKGREYLIKEFNVPTRNDLNEEQLISFVEKLKLIRNQYLSH